MRVPDTQEKQKSATLNQISIALFYVQVETRGLEPLTSTVRLSRSTS